MDARLGDLPPGCLASILSLTTPRDIARLSLVNKAFLEASRSDVAWSSMLPPHWYNIIREPARGAKSVYEQLCAGVVIGVEEEEVQSRLKLFISLISSLGCLLQVYWIDRPTGGICNMLSAKTLDIVWGDDDQYWDWRPMPGSRFREVAFLKDVCWLEVRGQYSGYLRPGRYTVSFRLQLLGSHERRRGRGDDWHEDAYGWDVEPVIFAVCTQDGEMQESARYLTDPWDLDKEQPLPNLAPARRMEDGWAEYDAGQFLVLDADEEVDVHFCFVEIKGAHWKSGLFLDGATIKPSFLWLAAAECSAS